METRYNSQVSFVTAFFNIYNDDKTKLLWRCEKFREIAKTGISLCVYVDNTGLELLNDYITIFPNIKIMRVLSLEETWISKLCNQYPGLHLPKHRNETKDTLEYIILMNSKIEFLQDTIEKNPWQSTHFAWIDFNISHVFTNIQASTNYLKNTFGSSHTPLSGVPLHHFLAIPGCWKPLQTNSDMSNILDNINWRFCGGFLIGDRLSIIHMQRLYQEFFPIFLNKYQTIVWEVNFWAWLELRAVVWNPNWFIADHNDSIIVIPTDYTAVNISNLRTTHTIVYDYPNNLFTRHLLGANVVNESFLPGSASFIHHKGQNILNTRFVNYHLDDFGNYIFHHPDNKIITQNVLSILDERMTPTPDRIEIHLEPINYTIMSNPSENEFPSKSCNFHGFEDIRLFEHDDVIKFIATSINYSPYNYNSMVIGTFDIEQHKLCNCQVIKSPRESLCEKNWTPIPYDTHNRTNKKMYFIYKWSPMEIGFIDKNTHKLNIVKTHSISSHLFSKFRGSTTFIREKYNNIDVFIGVVHFSENNAPRHYFHTLVMLDAITLKPIRYTKSFYFTKIGIEFCIGFIIRNNKYHFWISQNDRDPMKISLDISKLPFLFEDI